MFFSYDSAVRECRRMNQGDVPLGAYTITKRWYGWVVVLYEEEIKRFKVTKVTKDYRLWIIDEKNELHEKIKKLVSFIFSDKFKELSEKEQGLMRMQHKYMLLHISVLEELIGGFK